LLADSITKSYRSIAPRQFDFGRKKGRHPVEILRLFGADWNGFAIAIVATQYRANPPGSRFH
jgi:hypothetical protein